MASGLEPTHTSLRDPRAFPSFASCPDENDVPYIYYDVREDGVYAPSRHWCFLGEITESTVFMRLRLEVQDKEGETIPIAFHLDHRDHPGIKAFFPGETDNKPDHRNLPHHLIGKGNTIAVLYAQRHDFADMTTGLRIEDADVVQIFPCNLAKLLSLSDLILSGGVKLKSDQACDKCGNTSTSLQRCSGCHLACYCSKDCQTADWSGEGHKKDCKLAKQIALLMKKDWLHFTKYYTFPLSKQ